MRGPRRGHDCVLQHPRPAQPCVAVASGVFFAADLILWHHSIGDVGAGLATVLANIQVVLVPLVAWAVLSERPGRKVLAPSRT